MRYRFIFYLLTCLFGCHVSAVLGQSPLEPASFPTYNQIKPANQEIIDYMPKEGKSGVIYQKMTFKLFDYPPGTVTYFLNATKAANEAEAKERINQKGNQIINIFIGVPTADGNRIINIDYVTDKQPNK